MKAPLFLILGFALGIIGIALVRFVMLEPPPVTHFHANFSVFVSGKRWDFSKEKYMEDVEKCKPEFALQTPQERVHLHNLEGDVVHIHSKGVTWGHFFSNLGFSFASSHLMTDEGRLLLSNNKNSLKFVLNGEKIDSPFNRLISNEDRLLISYGPENMKTIEKIQWPLVPESAKNHNEEKDPGSCSGNVLPWNERLKKSFLW